MPRSMFAVVSAAMLLATFLASPARAGDWQYDPAADLIYYGSVPVARWYEARPSLGAAQPWHRESAHPVPPCPHRLCGYPLPIYKAPRIAAVPVVRTYRVRVTAHVEWCAAHYRSYDVRTDMFQPYHGPRRHCRSPFR